MSAPDPTGGAYSWFQLSREPLRKWRGGEGLEGGERGREGKGASWGNSALVVGEYMPLLTVKPIYRIFLLYHVITSRHVRKRTVIRTIFGIRRRTADFS